jgi:uncharacterized membrane protein
MSAVPLVITACAGFLLAVLWMDLMFDSQLLAHRRSPEPLPEPVLASIAGYYRRATTTSRPMSTLIVIVMMILLIALALRAIFGNDPAWLVAASTVLAGVPILLALMRTVPNAVRLGKRVDSLIEQTRLARAVFGDHVLCLALVAALVCLRLAEAA